MKSCSNWLVVTCVMFVSTCSAYPVQPATATAIVSTEAGDDGSTASAVEISGLLHRKRDEVEAELGNMQELKLDVRKVCFTRLSKLNFFGRALWVLTA